MAKGFDVFLSYNRREQAAVLPLAEALRDRGLKVWLDDWVLAPGEPWKQSLEAAIQIVPAVAILVGDHAEGPWQALEMRSFLDEFVRRKARIVPVLLPGAPADVALPPFLNQFNWLDLRGGLTPDGLDRLVWGIRGRKSRRRARASSDPVPRPEPADAGIAAYRSWALERYRGMTLMGLGAAEIRMRFEEVYVPLRIARRPGLDGLEDRGEKRRGRLELAAGCEDLEVEDVFAAGSPHALILGHPGAGKTTALLKLLHTVLAEGSKLRGLAPGTVPVLVRLRRLSEVDLDRQLPELLGRELAEVSGEVIPADLGPRLWARGRLLLLLDGLDEIADERLRAQVCAYLDWSLTGAERRGVRAVISCRFAGYGGREEGRDGAPAREVRFSEHVLPLELRPLGAEQCRRLVRQWFQEARQAVRDYSEAEAHRAAEGLIAALEAPGYGTQAWKVLIGSPLLLTLLCVIVLRGGQMPRQRVAFFDQSLRLLLAQWSRGKRADDEPPPEPPLDVETALAVLRSLAWELHAGHRRDDLSLVELADHVEELLGKLDRPASGFQVGSWLHREAGVLAEYAPGQFGFLHLGLQEYLAALHAACQGEELLAELCARCGDEWWHEVLLLLAGLPGRRLFGPLLQRLLAPPGLAEREELIRACLESAAEVDLEPLLGQLDPAVPPERLAVLLRLLRGRSDPRIAGRVAPLTGSAHPAVAALARQIVAEQEKPAGVVRSLCDLFVIHHPADRESAAELVHVLRRASWRVLVSGEAPLSAEILDGALAVAVLAGPSGSLPWEERDLYRTLRLFARRRRPLLPVRLPGAASANPVELPQDLPLRAWVDLGPTLAGAAEVLQLAVAERAVAAEAPRAQPETAWTESETGIRFLWIPGGRFRMGGDRYSDEQPVHWVRLSPFWLGETPVTNRQYAVFLEKTGHEEPPTWRDRRYSAPEQPVVGVSWEDARSFCRWLSDLSGRKVDLPSEAQWELAARGTDGREYPWGDAEPDETRACFGLDYQKGQPSPVGAYPEGRGPFGTLDQAGNVWEWCLDVWDENAYRKRIAKGGEPADLVVDEGDKAVRVLRGGGWVYPAESLRAAYRNRLRAGNRDGGIGFRVAAAPASS